MRRTVGMDSSYHTQSCIGIFLPTLERIHGGMEARIQFDGSMPFSRGMPYVQFVFIARDHLGSDMA
jgi:hypothetical protein